MPRTERKTTWAVAVTGTRQPASRQYRQAKHRRARATPDATNLEDVFIRLMGQSEDNFAAPKAEPAKEKTP